MPVRDREAAASAILHRLQRAHDLGRGTRLADRDHQLPAVVDLDAVERVQARSRQRDGPSRCRLEQVAAVDRGMVRRAAGGDDDAVQLRGRHRADAIGDRVMALDQLP